MSKRKSMSDAEAVEVAPLRRTAAPRHGKRTVAQLKTGSIGVHRKSYPRLSLLGLPREIRDMIYDHIPLERVVKFDMTRNKRACHFRDLTEPAYYTDSSPAPPKYAGLAIDDKGVNELLQPAKYRRLLKMFLICHQINAEYRSLFNLPRFRYREHMRVKMHNYDFAVAVNSIIGLRPTHVVIDLTTDEDAYEEVTLARVLKWAHWCKTPDENNSKAAEMQGHKFTLTFEENLGYESKEALVEAKYVRRKVQFLCIGALGALPPGPESNSIKFLKRHNDTVVEWMYRNDGTDKFRSRNQLEDAEHDVMDHDEEESQREQNGLVNESSILGRKRDLEDMQAGGRADPLDAQSRIMMKRLARWNLN